MPWQVKQKRCQLLGLSGPHCQIRTSKSSVLLHVSNTVNIGMLQNVVTDGARYCSKQTA